MHWLHSSSIKGGLVSSLEELAFLFGSGNQGRSHIICHYCLIPGSTQQGRESQPALSSGPREPALWLVGFMLPAWWLQARAEKHIIIFIFFENRSDHICLPCLKQNKEMTPNRPFPAATKKKQNLQWVHNEAIGCTLLCLCFSQ